MKRVDVVYNPKSGRGRAPALAERLARVLDDRRLQTRRFTIGEFLSHPTHPGEQDCIVTLGGDGTVRAIVEGLIARNRSPLTPVAILAMGTANLLSQHLRLPWNETTGLPLLADAVVAGHVRTMDVATANGAPFLLMCSAGFDAQVVHEVAARRSGPITMLHYLPALGRSALKLDPRPVRVVVDGRTVFADEPALVVVANAAEYGAGFLIAPSAVSDDGLLDVTVFRASTHDQLLKIALHAVTGQIEEGAAVRTRGRAVQILGDGIPAQIDGEAFGHTPVEIGLLPLQANFIVPA